MMLKAGLETIYVSNALVGKLTSSEQDHAVDDISKLEHVSRKQVGRYLSGVAVVALATWIVLAFVHGQINWTIVGRYLMARTILLGLGNTVLMAALAMLLGVLIGVTVAIMRLSANPVVNWAAASYVWFFRGTPLLLQLLLWFNLALVFPKLGIPGLFELRTVDVMTPFLAALLGLGINQGAYTSEVVRAGLLSVDQGQYEAASAIGMPRLQALHRIILPQAMRVIVPPIGNELIGMVKLTSLASVIQFSEIVHNAENIYYVNNYVIEMLIVAAFWYLIVVTVLTFLQARLERHYARGARNTKPR
ncbi:amino acid ABC transporter permease [Bradyrhizobium sp. CIAT3101]|uniref:amino acid ABC transporter permease n=1 Tax=Bradyrhizobium sp. CIAT3101 TaxID=439387 RepID=UPI0024B069B3|nr:amino acid ABC transporter permease [Bradyrhizobium sp. CIAT3101]WFU80528.1 amino acid ABC transporter permease [Bradyrhizobium sp. CIAT3101]